MKSNEKKKTIKRKTKQKTKRRETKEGENASELGISQRQAIKSENNKEKQDWESKRNINKEKQGEERKKEEK